MLFGTFFKNLRINANLDQKQMASWLGVAQGTISKIERDILEPSATNIVKVLTTTKLSADCFNQPKPNYRLAGKRLMQQIKEKQQQLL